MLPTIIPLLSLLGATAARAAATTAVRAGGANLIRTAATAGARTAATAGARTAAKAGARGSLLGRAAVTYTAADILGGVLGSFFSGGAQAVTGGLLGGDGNAAGGRGGSSSLSSSASLAGVGGADGNFSDANKENCCCCRETLSLLSSIDRTLKIGLNVSKAQLDLEASRNASERERMAESKLPGLGGNNEKLQDIAEEAGFNVGKSLLDLAIGNFGQLLRLGGSEKYYKDLPADEPGEEGRKEGKRGRAILGVGEASGMASGGLVVGRGGPREDKNLTRLSNGEFVVNADSTRANLGMLTQINSNPFSVAAQKQKENQQQAQIIGAVVGESIKRIFKDMNVNQSKIAYLPPRSSETPKANPPGGARQDNIFSQIFKNNSNSLVDLIGKVESNRDPNVFRRGGEAVERHDLQSMTIDEVAALGGTAYGKYQFIPETLKMLAKELKLDTSKVKFTEFVQDKLANHQLMKIKSVRTAMKDPSEQNISSAMTDISHVWRGLPDPRTGTTYQDKFAGGNKAGTSVGEFRKRFEEYLKDQRKSPLEDMMDILKKPGQMLDQIALMGEANKNKQTASTVAPVVINNQSGGQQQRMPAVMLPIDGPTLPNSMVAAVSQFSSSRYA